MPELPEVETVRRGLAPALEGRRITRAETRREGLRFPFPVNMAQRLTGARIQSLGRRAKYLTADLDSGETLIMHLGMTGRFTLSGLGFDVFAHASATTAKHDHVRLELEGDVIAVYNDPRRFGFFELWPAGELETYPAFAALGPEPISNAFSSAYLGEALHHRRTPIKSALLDQSIIAGLGNIYVCEALYRAGISPKRAANTLGDKRVERLTVCVRDVINEAIEAGGSSISDFAATDGALGYFQHAFRVYGRENNPCRSCERPIRRIVQSGRSTFYCSACQR